MLRGFVDRRIPLHEVSGHHQPALQCNTVKKRHGIHIGKPAIHHGYADPAAAVTTGVQGGHAQQTVLPPRIAQRMRSAARTDIVRHWLSLFNRPVLRVAVLQVASDIGYAFDERQFFQGHGSGRISRHGRRVHPARSGVQLHIFGQQCTDIRRIDRQVVFHHLDSGIRASLDGPGGQKLGRPAGAVRRIVFIGEFHPVFIQFGARLGTDQQTGKTGQEQKQTFFHRSK